MVCAPSDEVGHGTHVTGIAAATGASGKYPGIAPKADIVFVRVTEGASEGIDNENLVRAVGFMFDRANAENKPMVVNLSLGSDFGPHDGTMLWEQAIASRVGPDHPGHIIVAAAGNSGSIVENPIHQSVRVTKGARLHVPVTTHGATAGSVQIWITPRKGADFQIGLDGPDGEWIAPVDPGHQGAKVTSLYQAEVLYGPSSDPSNQIPAGTSGAIVAWQGSWPTGTYWITLEGTGMAEMYLQAGGDAAGDASAAGFANAVREGTINLPATHPAIIGVGCTVNRPNWTSIAGADVALKSPVLDPQGGLPTADAQGHVAVRNLFEGEVCWFSSAGPTAAGVPKPEIAAPGALVISALSRNAAPGQPSSVFTSGACPATKSGAEDKRCLQIDDTHGIAVGTSMSSPVVAGVVALLLQQDPTLTQDQVLALLQAGAHRYRTSTQFDDEAGPGEVDAMGSLEALDRMKTPALYMPAASSSWITLSSDYVPADGSTPITAIVELRTADGAHRGDLFDANRLSAVVLVDGQPVSSPAPVMVRRGPGVWFYEWNPPAGLGGSHATFSANFDGVPIVAAKTLPIGVDRWTSLYPSQATGASCSSSRAPLSSSSGIGALLSALALASLRRWRGTVARA
jgi:subtilisin family serine protease